MKRFSKLIATFILLLLLSNQSFAQQDDKRRKKETPLEIPGGALKLIIEFESESSFTSSTSFVWKMEGIKDNAQADALAAKIMAADANMKSVSIKNSTGKGYDLSFQLKEAFKDTSFLKIFNACGIEYASVNGRDKKLTDYTNK